MSVRSTEKTDIEIAFQEFKKTRFYQWLDRIIAGPYRWLVLPVTGIIDAFVVIIPTELVVAMYMMRNQGAIWWVKTIWVTAFAALGYGLLAVIVKTFGIDAVGWLSHMVGDDIAGKVTITVTDYVWLFAATAGLTSVFPMPATAFAITVGLFDLSVVLLMIGTFVGKFGRFGIFAYGANRWGNQAVQYYFKHANTISIVVIILIVIYLVIQ